jgi:hypothetical protein
VPRDPLASRSAYGRRVIPYLAAAAGFLVAVIAAGWASRRTDALRRVDPRSAQRIDEARGHFF